MIARARGLGLFAASVLLNGVASLVSIPVLVAVVGADPWASMATGQSIGASFGVLVIFGWGLTGPVQIAVADPERRPVLFLDSLFARGVLLVPLLAVEAAVTFAIVPQEKGVAFLAGAAMTLAGASANWYFTGESRADRFLLLDTVPRVAGTVTGVLLVAATGQLVLFALAQLAGAVAALVVSSGAIFRGSKPDLRASASPARIRRSLLEQRHGVVATGVLAAYIPAALAIIAVFSPALLPMFVLADRLGKFVAQAVSPVQQVFQGWVPAAEGAERGRRLRIGARVVTGIALASGALYTVFLAPASDLLTHGQVRFPLEAVLAFGINMTLTVVSPYLTNLGLVAYGRLRTIAVSVAVSVVVTLTSLITVGALAPDQAVWALVGGNVLMTTWQVLVLMRAVRAAESAQETLTPVLTPNNAEQITAAAGSAGPANP
jgi:O-antigen/teichoic acid export membrane protein